MIKKYSVKELATILGCSLTAVNKKIVKDDNNPEIKRYRNRYQTVVEENVTYILLDDEALEDEKRRSKGFKAGFTNVSNTVSNEYETTDYIDVEPVLQNNNQDKLLEFTQRYINDFTTLQKTFYDEMRQKDQQIYLLTTSENQKQAEYLETQAKNKQLVKQNNVLKTILTVVITLFATLAITFIALNISKNKDAEPVEVPKVETVQETLPQPVVKPVAAPKKPVQRTNTYQKRTY